MDRPVEIEVGKEVGELEEGEPGEPKDWKVTEEEVEWL